MGRKKLEMKLIEDKSSRQVTFSKRRSGLIKKARELSILCDVEVALLVFSSRGRLYEFCSGTSLASILDRYRNHSEEEEQSRAEATNAQACFPTESGGRSHTDLLQQVHRLVEEPDAEDFSVDCLMELEKDLTAALARTRCRKMQLMMDAVMALQEQERLLREENELLEGEVAALTAEDGRGEEAGPSGEPPTTLDLLR